MKIIGDELVSIIMPSYNTENYIAQSIESVLNQSYTNWELIIIDDCSTDNSEFVIKKFKDHRIHFYKNPSNLGAAISRNIALKKAKGKWIAFLDSDDLWDKDKLSKQIFFMKSNGYHFSYTNYREVDEQNNVINNLISGPRIITKRKLYDYNWLGCLTVMYDASFIGLIEIPDIKKRNDYALWLKVIKKCNCYLLNETLASYRKRKGSISNHSIFKLIEHHYVLFRKCEEKNILISLILTVRNLFFGLLKRIIYK